MKFLVKDMDVETGGIMVAILHMDDADRLDLHPGDRIRITHNNYHAEVVVDIGESEKSVPIGYVGLFEEVLAKIHAVHRSVVRISLAEKPESVFLIKKKLAGHHLKPKEIHNIVADIVDNKLTDIELTYYVAANYTHGMNVSEIVALTKAMIDTGEKLKLKNGKIVDIHCIGGVAGNRTTMLVVPIVAAAGLTIPKTSSRAITSPSGTADTMEVLCKVDLSTHEIKQVIKKTNGCIVWGGAVNLAPADDLIIGVEHPLSIDPEGQLLASIMAKKGAMGVTHMLLDIPMGNGSKVLTKKQALHLKHEFLKLAKELKIDLSILISDGTQPIGNGIGPVLEVRDSLWALQNDARAPEDLVKKSVCMAGMVLEQCSVAKKGQGIKKAWEIVKNGKAYEKFVEIVRAQHGHLPDANTLLIGPLSYVIRAPKSGKVKMLSNQKLSKIARLAGCPKDRSAGLYIHKHVGANVRKGEPIVTIYAENKQRLEFAVKVFNKMDGIMIS